MSNIIATPAQIANVVLTLSFGKNGEYKLTPYKLGKMVYMIYAWYYAIYDKLLFPDSILIGENGPTVQEIDNQFSVYKNSIIPNGTLSSTYNVDKGEDIGRLVSTNPEHLKVINVANTVLHFYQNDDDTEIRRLTHEKDSVWYIETDNGKSLSEKIGQKITNKEAIKERATKAIERFKSQQVR